MTRATERLEPAGDRFAAAARAAEVRIGRFLIALTYVAVILLVVGVGVLLATGTSPLSGGPDLNPSVLLDHLRMLDAAGFLWLGLLAVIATPLGRVVLAGLAFARQRDWQMVCVAAAILAIVAVGVIVARAGTV